MEGNPVIEPAKAGRPRKFNDSELERLIRLWFAPGSNRSAIARGEGMHAQSLRAILARAMKENPALKRAAEEAASQEGSEKSA